MSTDPNPIQPLSLTGHAVPPERLAVIAPHVARLSQTALEVSDRLALGRDTGDVFAVMARDADARRADVQQRGA